MWPGSSHQGFSFSFRAMGGGEKPDYTSDTLLSSSSSSSFHRFCSSARRAKILVPPSSGVGVSTRSGGSLVRRLGPFDLILIGLGASIGAGIFVVTGTVARSAGPGVTISFILAGASCVLNALCCAELAVRFPAVVGGVYMYTYTAFNELTAFMVFAHTAFDGHIGAASLARSLASYMVALLELFPIFKDRIPSWIGNGEELLGGVLCVNILAPILVAVLTFVLCCGVGESSTLNSVMTVTKVIIITVVILVGAFEVDFSNWSPFAPSGSRGILTGTTVVFFAYIGFDAVANLAEESKRPKRDLPIGILGSLLICIVLYVAVCLVITGMVPYQILGEDAPLADAFAAKGMKYATVLISVGAVAGLTSTLLTALYIMSRLYLSLGRDGLLPPFFAKVHPGLHTPVRSQIWCGIIAGVLAGFFNVNSLSHILSVGVLTGYTVVAACVLTLGLEDENADQVSSGSNSIWRENVTCLVMVGCCGFASGALYRFGALLVFPIVAVALAAVASAALYFRHVYSHPTGSSFSCPGVPIVPCVCVFFNLVLFAQLHYEAWLRFVIVSAIAACVYAAYGQYHADPSSDESLFYHGAPPEETI